MVVVCPASHRRMAIRASVHSGNVRLLEILEHLIHHAHDVHVRVVVHKHDIIPQRQVTDEFVSREFTEAASSVHATTFPSHVHTLNDA
eukprot:6205971-Pleurochrysis_carterae.AAC.2